MLFDTKNRWSGAVQFTAEIECSQDASESIKKGLAVRWALENGANLTGANLTGAYLGGANLTGANLEDANLGGANLTGANLGGANLRGANLRGANLTGANLEDANLGGANLTGANLRGAYLRGAYLRGANLTGAYLGGATCQFGKLLGSRPIIQIGPIGSENRILLGYHVDEGVHVRAGCFNGSLSDFEEAVNETHGGNAFGREYRAFIDFLKVWGELQKASSQEEAA